MLDGKKKFTATAMGFLTSILGGLVTSGILTQQSAEPVIQILAIAGPLALAFGYDIFQGVQDNKKETVKIEHEKTIQVQAQTTPSMPTPEVIEAAFPVPFDAEAFDKKVESKAPETYLDANDMTRFFAARDLGRTTPCSYLNKAVDYWLYLLDKAHKAFICKFGYPYNEAENHLADDKSCPYYSVENMARQKGIDYYAMLRELKWAERKVKDIEELYHSDIDWITKLERPTLYSVGQLAQEMLKG